MKYTDIQKKSDVELTDLIVSTRERLRAENFKDKFSKKASIIRTAKNTIARALSEVGVRRRNPLVK